MHYKYAIDDDNGGDDDKVNAIVIFWCGYDTSLYIDVE